MSQRIKLLIDEAFTNIQLHRMEANIQPENVTSIKLASRAGFSKEGFSPNYLRIGGKDWKDHERWAIVNYN
jgi:ribosomal-protein-alanine N-acetyltransferase